MNFELFIEIEFRNVFISLQVSSLSFNILDFGNIFVLLPKSNSFNAQQIKFYPLLYFLFWYNFCTFAIEKNYLNCSIMPAALTRPKKKVVIENTFIEKDEITTKVSAVQEEKEHRTEEEKKEKRGTRKIRS